MPRRTILPRVMLFAMGFGVNGQTIQTTADCNSTEVLKEMPGVKLGTCVPGSTYNTLQNVVMVPDNGEPPYVVSTLGGPGYVINNKAVELCELGYYCPFNPQTNLYDQKIQCEADTFCYEGAVEPKDCKALQNCPDGCSLAAGAGGAVLFVILLLVVVCLGVAFKMRETRMLKQSQLAFDEYMDDDFSDFGKKFEFDIKPVSIEFLNMGMRIKGAKASAPPILQNVTGHFPPSSLVALMGPSGCGKTTFMNAVVDRAPYGVVSGTVKINGVPNGIAKASNTVGYVPQDDIVHGSMTVFQNLYYHAKLRLPRATSGKDILEHVQKCITVLGLVKVQNVVVGTPEKRGISGGQKKRVNIGMELAAMPSVMFMDEPTSGLDGAATVNLARCLGLLKGTGLTIICVIHQPRWAVFAEFTHLLLLGEGGQQVFSGRAEYIVPYLRELGFRPPEHENPADWMIDVCSNLENRYIGESVDESFECPRDLYKEWSEKHAADAAKPGSRWHRGDPEPQEPVPLQSRQTPGLCTSYYCLVGRVFLKTNLAAELQLVLMFIFLGLFDSLAGIIALTQGCNGFKWAGLSQKFVPSFLFAVFVGMQHRTDYGEDKLIISREVNSGIYFSAIWAGRSVKSICFGVLKFLGYAIVRFIFETPQQSFIMFVIPWLLLGLWWVAFAQLVSLLCRNQMTAVTILLLTPIFEQILSGNYCHFLMETDIASGFCPKGGMNGHGFWPGHNFFKMLWTGELDEFPSHVLEFPIVNRTNYWYDIPNNEVTASGTVVPAPNATGLSYSVSTFLLSDATAGWWAFFANLVWTNILLRLLCLLCLAFMAASTNRWVADKIALASYHAFRIFGCCRPSGFSVPQDELNPPHKAGTTAARMSRQASMGASRERAPGV